MAVVVIHHDSNVVKAMKPNEWGDFFGGIFAPLAFLWLILGYLQQGDELQLSTKALHLQAKELKNSVEQQRELVEVTRMQLESEREALNLEIGARREAAKPLFVIKDNGGSFSPNKASHRISISNAGNTVTDVHGHLENLDQNSKFDLFDIGMFARLGEIHASFEITPPFPELGFILSITYVDTYGQPGEIAFGVTKRGESTNSPLQFIQTFG